MLNPDLDRKALAAAFAEDERVRIEGILDPEVAERIRNICLERVPWEYLTFVDGRNVVIPSQELEKLGQERLEQMFEQINAAAADGVGFFYCGYKIDRRQDDSGDEDLRFLHDVFEYLNGEEMLGFVSEISGRDDLRSADAQYTRYTASNFLTRHRDDEVDGRRLAYVIGFSRNWHPDWGGLLQFFSDDGTARDAWVPKFNTMSLFGVRHVHSVTYVTPFTKEPRLSLTGWYRAAADG